MRVAEGSALKGGILKAEGGDRSEEPGSVLVIGVGPALVFVAGTVGPGALLAVERVVEIGRVDRGEATCGASGAFEHQRQIEDGGVEGGSRGGVG